MYENEKEELRKITGKNSGNEAYEEVKKKVDTWGGQTAKRVRQELQRDYEIGVPVDRVTEVVTLCVAVFSLLISCIALALGDSGKGDTSIVNIATVGFGALLVLEVALIHLSYPRKRKIRAAIDILDSLLELEIALGEEKK